MLGSGRPMMRNGHKPSLQMQVSRKVTKYEQVYRPRASGNNIGSYYDMTNLIDQQFRQLDQDMARFDRQIDREISRAEQQIAREQRIMRKEMEQLQESGQYSGQYTMRIESSRTSGTFYRSQSIYVYGNQHAPQVQQQTHSPTLLLPVIFALLLGYLGAAIQFMRNFGKTIYKGKNWLVMGLGWPVFAVIDGSFRQQFGNALRGKQTPLKEHDKAKIENPEADD